MIHFPFRGHSLRGQMLSAAAIACLFVAAPPTARGQNFNDAANFGFSVFGAPYAESLKYSQTWDAIPAEFSGGRNAEAFGINTAFGSALGISQNAGFFPKLNAPDLNLGSGDGLDPRDGTILLYSSIRFGVLSPENGRIEVSIGSAAPDSEDDPYPRQLATNIWRPGGSVANNGNLENTVLGSRGSYGDPGYDLDAIGVTGIVTPADNYSTNANPFFTAGAFDNTKYVHFAAAINLLDATAGTYEILSWFRRDAGATWELYQRDRIGFDGADPFPFDLGDIGQPHPVIAGAKQGFINALGFVGLTGIIPNQVFYGRHAITQLNGQLLDGDFNLDGNVDGADFLLWQRGLGQSGDALLNDGDANGDKVVDAADLQVWRDHFGESAPVSAIAGAAVPEPTALGLLVIAMASLVAARVR